MKAVQWYAPRQMRLVDIPVPTPLPHEALIRIESCGVCGSDMHYYLDGHIGNQVIRDPLILGHEYAGIVEAVGESADKSLLGKRVAVEPGVPCATCEYCLRGEYNVCPSMTFPGGPGCDGAFAEFITVHAGFCFPVPEEMPAVDAAMIEPLAVAIHTVELARLKPGETAAIIGLGPIGLLTAAVAKYCGVNALYGTDLHAYRVQAASQFGLDMAFAVSADTPGEGGQETVDHLMQVTSGRGVDVAFDCSNGREGIGIACRITRPAGRCVLTGISGHEVDPLPVSIARRRELSLHWCRRFKHNFPTAIALLQALRIDIKPLLTHSFPLEQTCEAFELVANSQDNVLKVSIDQ